MCPLNSDNLRSYLHTIVSLWYFSMLYHSYNLSHNLHGMYAWFFFIHKTHRIPRTKGIILTACPKIMITFQFTHKLMRFLLTIKLHTRFIQKRLFRTGLTDWLLTRVFVCFNRILPSYYQYPVTLLAGNKIGVMHHL